LHPSRHDPHRAHAEPARWHGSLVGLPLGLVAFRHADPILVRAAAGVTIFGFAVLMAVSRRRSGQPGQRTQWTALAMSPGLDLAAGAVSGIANAVVGMGGPPVLICQLLAGAEARTVRATLLAFFALSYAVTLVSHAATIGIPATTWLAAGILVPFAFLGGLAGRPIGDRLGAKAFTVLAIALLAVARAPRPLPLPPPSDDRARGSPKAPAIHASQRKSRLRAQV
jgi:uncharacterized protein